MRGFQEIGIWGGVVISTQIPRPRVERKIYFPESLGDVRCYVTQSYRIPGPEADLLSEYSNLLAMPSHMTHFT